MSLEHSHAATTSKRRVAPPSPPTSTLAISLTFSRSFFVLTPDRRKVFDDYVNEMDKSSTLLTSLPTPVFWYGLVVGQEFSICPANPADLLLKDGDGGDGATEVKVRLERVGPAKKGGMRTVSFTVGGAVQNVEIKDSVSGNDFDGPMAGAGNALEVGCCCCCSRECDKGPPPCPVGTPS